MLTFAYEHSMQSTPTAEANGRVIMHRHAASMSKNSGSSLWWTRLQGGPTKMFSVLGRKLLLVSDSALKLGSFTALTLVQPMLSSPSDNKCFHTERPWTFSANSRLWNGNIPHLLRPTLRHGDKANRGNSSRSQKLVCTVKGLNLSAISHPQQFIFQLWGLR